ncbi:tetratricopeptide repeat protein [Candidatus Poribacteria bacterium]|nr:tetratricopeptide repeat protein [Candidatus Poribacteria bacterium]
MLRNRIFFYVLLFIITRFTFAEVIAWDITTLPDEVQNQLRNVQKVFQEEKWNEVYQIYHSIGKQHPGLPIVHIGLGDVSGKLRNYENAITSFEHALELISQFPHIERILIEPTVQAKLGTAYHRNMQLDKADEFFQKAVKGAGENAPVNWYIALGQIETERGNLEQARRYYIVAVQLEPTSTTAYNNLGYVLLKLNRYDEADAVFREAYTLNGKLPNAIYGRGEVARKRDLFEAAQGYYEKAITINPDEPLFYKSLAELFVEIGEVKQANTARARYKQTLAKEYWKQARVFIEKQQGSPALELLQKALETDETYIPALKDYAFVQMQLNNLEEAKKTYQRVLTHETNSRQALLHIGMIEAKLGNHNNAEKHYLTLIQSDPDFMDTYSQLANLRKAFGDLIGTIEAYSMGIRQESSWAPGYFWRGQIQQQRGESAKAESDFRQAIKLAPDVPFPKNALASLLAEENRLLNEALVLAQDVVKTDKRPAHLATLAYVYYRLNMNSDARKIIIDAKSQDSKNLRIEKIYTEILKTD